jgi:ubiquinone biosynthesis protein UbiJ
LWAAERTRWTKKASTLSGKVAVLEGEATSLADTASALLKSIGVDDTTSNGAASLLQLGPDAHHGSKLKTRLAALEQYTAGVLDKTNSLEVNFFGAATAEKADSSHKQVERSSFKAQIETVAAQIDELKSRLSTLESSPLLGDVAKLEDTTDRLGAEATQIFTSIGVESVMAPAKPNIAGEALKDRLSSLEGYTGDLQRNAASLEYEVVGNSWSKPPSVSSRSQSASCIKDHAASLGDQLTDLKNRLSALTSSPIVADVGKMEDAVTSLSSRAASLSKNVGIDSLTQDLSLAPQGAPLKSRVVSLEGYIGNMQTTTAALEDQLAGKVSAAPALSQKDTLKSKTKFLELQIENMNSRITSLEQQV